VPTFCRHGRVLENCSICSKASRTHPGTVADREAARRSDTPARAPRETAPRSVAAKRRAQRPRSDMVVRRVHRAVDDGYDNPLVPGMRASDDARRLADELAFANARLDALGGDPPGLYGEAASASDREEGLWLAFEIALLSPLDGTSDAFFAVDAARVPWGTGESPALDGAELGPRAGDARKLLDTISAYRSRAAKAGSQAEMLAGEAAWTPQRRFDRAFERLAFAGFGRSARYEFLLTAGRLGLADVEPWSLALVDALDPVTVAAKRVFGIGDAVLLGRRSSELAAACSVPIGALDLALFNWARAEERYTAGVPVEPDESTRDRVAAALAVS
jgi:hypothetical protein